MRASADIVAPDGTELTLTHGDLIGRVWHAALRIPDGRISEAHAMVSHRGRDLKLLALRGRFAVNGRLVNEAILRAGVEVALAKGLAFQVISVDLPDQVLAIEAPGVQRQILTGTTSLWGGSRTEVRSGWAYDAHRHLWLEDDGWYADGEDGPVALQPGTPFEVAGTAFLPTLVDSRGVERTEHQTAQQVPLRLVAQYDTVQLHRAGHEPLLISGHGARILSDLATAKVPVSWESLAHELWGEDDRRRLRRRWDMQMLRLRRKLRDHGLPSDLVHPSGDGLVELVLRAGDVVEDRT